MFHVKHLERNETMKLKIGEIILVRLIMWLCHIECKRYKQDIFFIKGTGKDFPKYLLYTENINTYNRMDKF